VKGYRLWGPTAHKVVVSRAVTFIENELQIKQANDNFTKEITMVQIKEKKPSNDYVESEQEYEEQELNEVGKGGLQ